MRAGTGLAVGARLACLAALFVAWVIATAQPLRARLRLRVPDSTSFAARRGP
jgi:hypothetical protein